MVTGDVVFYDSSKELYHLPSEKIDALADASYFSCWLTRCLGTYPQLLKAMPNNGPSGMIVIFFTKIKSLREAIDSSFTTCCSMYEV